MRTAPFARATALALAVIGTAGLAAPAARAADEAEVEKIREEAEKIGAAMEKIRGLSFKGPVHKGIQSRAELRAFIMGELEKELPDKKAREMEKAYARIGFIPADLDLKKLMIDLYSEQIAGFYNPEKKELFLMEDGGEEQSVVMAHELVHALQDQNFDLLPLQKAIVDNDDRALALTSLIEGDATVGMIAFLLKEQLGGVVDVRMLPDLGPMIQGMNQMGEALGGAGGPGGGGQVLKKAPAVLRENMLFGYMQGATFAQRLIKRGGSYKAVSAAFADLPTSSEQILHPEKYAVKTRDEPVEVVLPDLAAGLGKGWTRLMKNVMGEYNTALLFKEKLPGGESDKAAAGWGGDAWQVLEGPDGEVVFVWVSTWDTARDAEQFAETYVKFREKRGGAGKLQLEVQPDGATVWLVDGHQSGPDFDRIAAALKGTTTRKGYGGAAIAAREPEETPGGAAASEPSPFASLTAPEGWTPAATEDPAVKLAWVGPGGARLSVVEGPAAAKDGERAARVAGDELKSLSSVTGIETGKKIIGGKAGGLLKYKAGKEQHMQWYAVRGDRQHVLAITGRPEAVASAVEALREANPGVIGGKEPRKPEAKPEREKEPQLF